MKEQFEGPSKPELIDKNSIPTDLDENNHFNLYEKLKGKTSLTSNNIEIAQLTIFKKMLSQIKARNKLIYGIKDYIKSNMSCCRKLSDK